MGNQLNVKNVSGGTLPCPQVGDLADGVDQNLDLGLLMLDPDGREYLKNQVTATDFEIRYLGTELTDTQVEALFETVSAYHVEANPPMLDGMDIAVTGAMAAAGGDVKFVGRNLLQGQTFDTLVVTEGAAQLTLTMLKPGDSLVTVELVKGGGGSGVTYNPATRALVIDVGAAGDTDDNLATAVNANGAQTDGYVWAASASGGSFTAAQAAVPMTGGAGNYDANKVEANGGEALPANTPGISGAAAWNDTDITVTTPAGGGAATDVATAWIESNGLKSNVLSTILV